jgi:hypothetical protein
MTKIRWIIAVLLVIAIIGVVFTVIGSGTGSG